MTIKEKMNPKTGKIEYEVYAQHISKDYPHIRKQKRRTRVETLAKAKRIETELHEQCVRAVIKEEALGNCWAAIVYAWYEYEQNDADSNIGPDSLVDYYNSQRIWTKSIWDKPASQIIKADVKAIIYNMEKLGKSKSYQAKMKLTIKRIFDFGMEEGLIKNVLINPTIGIKVNRKTEKKPEVLNIEEVRQLLTLAKKHEHPWYPVWAMAVLTGCRNGELYALTWDDVDLSEKRIRVSKSYNTRRREVKSTKAGYYRNIPINSDLEKLIIELQNTSYGRLEVLPRLQSWDKGNQARVLRSFLELVGLPSVKFHTLRACFATMMLQLGKPAIQIMKICGWKDMDTMQRYVRLAAIEEAGATDCLELTPKEIGNNVVEFAIS